MREGTIECSPEKDRKTVTTVSSYSWLVTVSYKNSTAMDVFSCKLLKSASAVFEDTPLGACVDICELVDIAGAVFDDSRVEAVAYENKTTGTEENSFEVEASADDVGDDDMLSAVDIGCGTEYAVDDSDDAETSIVLNPEFRLVETGAVAPMFAYVVSECSVNTLVPVSKLEGDGDVHVFGNDCEFVFASLFLNDAVRVANFANSLTWIDIVNELRVS